MPLKNTLLKALLKCAVRSKHPKAAKRRLLIVSTTALGDTLWATPAIENLRASFPNAYLAALTSPIGKAVLTNNPHLDGLFVLKEPLLPRFFSLCKTLYREQFDTILVFHASQRLALPLCSLLGASQIIATEGLQKGLDDLLTDALPNNREHEIVRRLRMVEKIGGKTPIQTLSLYLTPEEESQAHLPPGRWVALHAGSKDAFKRWPLGHFAQVGRALAEKGYQILITGVREEQALLTSLAAQIPGATLSNTGLPLRAFAALLKKVDLLISNDTGPVHLACALDRPVVAIYSSTDPKLCGPHLAKRALAVAKRPTCTPCMKRRCRAPFCFLQITPEEVLDAALKLLNRHKSD